MPHSNLVEQLTQKFARRLADGINWMKIDPDFVALRDHPRFKAMLAEADQRMRAAGSPK